VLTRARAAWAVQRLLTDVADSISVISVWSSDGARANEMMMMMRPLRRRRWTVISYGVIDNRSQNPQH
jgi:hypothetical protein